MSPTTQRSGGDTLFSDGTDEREDCMEDALCPEVDAAQRQARLEALTASYDKVIPFNEALVIVVREGLYGLYDLNRERWCTPSSIRKSGAPHRNMPLSSRTISVVC